MARLLMTALALLALAFPAAAQEGCPPPVNINDGWTIARPDEVGLDAGQLCSLDKFVAKWKDANIHSVVVARGGKLVLERYWSGTDERWGRPLGVVQYGPEVKHDMRSISKSVTSLLVGLALGE